MAEVLERTCASRFQPRYRIFKEAVDSYKSPNLNDEDERSQLNKAIDLLLSGEDKAANELFDELEAAETESAERAKVRTMRIVMANMPRDEKCRRLYECETAHGQTAISQFYLGVYANRPVDSISYFEKSFSLASSTHDYRPSALKQKVIKQIEIGWLVITAHEIRHTLQGEDNALRKEIERILPSTTAFISGFERILLACFAFNDYIQKELDSWAMEALGDEWWNELAIFIGRKISKENGTALNWLGISYSSCGLNSIAFQAYTLAVDLGISVAKVNIAKLTQNGALPAIGLKILQDHEGPFDAASPGYPYRTRGELEEAVHKEQKKADLLEQKGKLLFNLLSDFAWNALRGTPEFDGMSFEFPEGPRRFEKISSGEYQMANADGTVKRNFKIHCNVLNYIVCEQDDTLTFITSREQGTLTRLVVPKDATKSDPILSNHLQMSVHRVEFDDNGDHATSGNRETAQLSNKA